MKKILITGATGQIGSELTIALRQVYGEANVVAVGPRRQPDSELLASGPYRSIDVLEAAKLNQAVSEYRVDTSFHLVSLP